VTHVNILGEKRSWGRNFHYETPETRLTNSLLSVEVCRYDISTFTLISQRMRYSTIHKKRTQLNILLTSR